MAEPAEATEPERRRGTKSATAFRTISEVAGDLDVPPHVLRFWESKFSQVRPLKRGGGRRYYRPEDIDLLRLIRELLYTDGYTIKGVQKLLRKDGIKAPGRDAEARGPAGPGEDARAAPQRAKPPPEPAGTPSAPAPVMAVETPTAGTGELEALRAAMEDVLAEIESLRESLRKAIG